MKKILIISMFTLILFSCKKDESSVNQHKDYSQFLNQSIPMFQGNIDESKVAWEFGLKEFQTVSGPWFFCLHSAIGVEDVTIYTPHYTTESEFSQIFTLGKQTFTNLSAGFYLVIRTETGRYQTSGEYELKEIEILKTQPYIDAGNRIPMLKVWFRIDADVLSTLDKMGTAKITDGLMIAAFQRP